MKRTSAIDVENSLLKKYRKAMEQIDIPPEPEEDIRPMTVVEAIRTEKLKNKLIEQFNNNRNASIISDTDRLLFEYPDNKETFKEVPQPPESKTITVAEAKKHENLKKKLQEEFADAKKTEEQETYQKEKQFEPITKAIREQSTTKPTSGSTKRVQISKHASFRPRAMSTPGKKADIFDASTLPALPSDTEEDDDTVKEQNKSIQVMLETRQDFGSVAREYLSRAEDDKFGIRYDLSGQQLKIGNSPVNIDGDDIVLVKAGKKYTGTEGLWKLLTKNGNIKNDEYTPQDWDNYKEILIETDSLYQKNDPVAKRPKSSQGQKWKKLIKFIYNEHLNKGASSSNTVSGSGLKEYNSNAIEYKYINSMNKLIDRLRFLQAEEDAGNNNFNNEKLSVVKFISDRLEDVVSKPNGLKYVIRCIAALPERSMEGSGILNDIINNLPFELHAPHTNFLGPGSRLKERLARGDRGVNKLDEAAREHDIWYSEHKNAEDRWVADKILQDVAFERAIAPDAGLYEKLLGLTTGSTMWAKRKLGLGLVDRTGTTSGCIYPV